MGEKLAVRPMLMSPRSRYAYRAGQRHDPGQSTVLPCHRNRILDRQDGHRPLQFQLSRRLRRGRGSLSGRVHGGGSGKQPRTSQHFPSVHRRVLIRCATAVHWKTGSQPFRCPGRHRHRRGWSGQSASSYGRQRDLLKMPYEPCGVRNSLPDA
jgi:hypothetical protein